MKETKFKQTLVQTKEGSRHCEEHSDMAIQGGFKMTELGLIPNDWKVKTFCELFEVLPNNTLSRAELNKEYGSYKNVHYGDILVEFGAWIDCSNVGLPFINSNAKFNHTVLQDGDIVIADTAEDETVGKSTEITNAKNKKIVSGLHTIPIRPKIKFAPKWLGYYINSACWHDQILPFITGTKVSAISKAAVSQTKLFFPAKIEEQQRIANALSDVDTLIANLERLIAKKKNIKQGAMQQLLTGKKRLPGFGSDERQKECHSERSAKREVEESSGYKMTELGLIPTDWEVKNLADLGYFFSGSGFPLKYQGHVDGKYPFYKVSDFNNVGNDFSMNIANNYVSEQIARKLGCKIIPKNAILFAKIGAAIMLERKKICTRACCADNNMMAFICYDFCDAAFMNAVLAMIKFADYSASSALPSLSSRTLGTIQIAVPHSKAEQTAIANVLSDMDAEISALETKLAKYRKLKTGMMQQLLTGKIRLV